MTTREELQAIMDKAEARQIMLAKSAKNKRDGG